jgi:hypothetical protein
MKRKSSGWLSFIAGVLVVVLLVFGAAYFSWWRCGEMFPHAQLACFSKG